MQRPAKRPAKKFAARTAAKAVERERTLAQRVAAAPQLCTPIESRKLVNAWLASIGRTMAGRALKRRVADAPKVAALLAGIAEGSPFLWELATAEPERLLALLDADPDVHLPAILSKTARAVVATKSEAGAMRLLRRMKAEGALLIALADIG